MRKISEHKDQKSSRRSFGARAGSAVAAAMTDHDHLVSGVILLVMAALAWTMTSLPELIVAALAIVGWLLILSALDEGFEAAR